MRFAPVVTLNRLLRKKMFSGARGLQHDENITAPIAFVPPLFAWPRPFPKVRAIWAFGGAAVDAEGNWTGKETQLTERNGLCAPDDRLSGPFRRVERSCSVLRPYRQGFRRGP